MKPIRRFRVQLQQHSASFMLPILICAGTPFFNDRNADARRQLSHRRWKIDMLVIHHKTKDTPAYAAAKTMKRLPLRTDCERWCFLLMEWTKRLERRAGTLE